MNRLADCYKIKPLTVKNENPETVAGGLIQRVVKKIFWWFLCLHF